MILPTRGTLSPYMTRSTSLKNNVLYTCTLYFIDRQSFQSLSSAVPPIRRYFIKKMLEDGYSCGKEKNSYIDCDKPSYLTTYGMYIRSIRSGKGQSKTRFHHFFLKSNFAARACHP